MSGRDKESIRDVHTTSHSKTAAHRRVINTGFNYRLAPELVNVSLASTNTANTSNMKAFNFRVGGANRHTVNKTILYILYEFSLSIVSSTTQPRTHNSLNTWWFCLCAVFTSGI